jgi:polar amino acid transport system substrate-binding protein
MVSVTGLIVRKRKSSMLNAVRQVALGAILLCGAVQTSAWAQSLTSSGQLRAVFLAQNPVQGVSDAATGAVRGPAAELTRELAKQLGVPSTIKGVGGTAAVMDAVKSGDADIGFLAYDETRAREVDFSQSYELAQNTFMVLQTSPLRTTADIDQGGLNIGVGEKDAADLFLTRNLKNAKLIRNPGGELDVAVRQLSTSQIDAYAANRQRLHVFAKANPSVRLLPDNFYGVEQAIVVRKGDTEGLPAVNKMIEAARASGLIAAAIQRAGLVGVDVAPPPGKK